MEDETNNNGGMDKWRRFFQGAGTDICTVIQYAIAVAVLDRPTEFRSRRDEIAQSLYTPVLCKCMKCDSMTLVEPVTDCSSKPSHTNSVQSNHGNGKVLEGKGTSCSIEGGEGDANRISGISFDDVEALNEEIEEDNEVHQEVHRIKAILDDPDESDSQVFECFRKLELMQLTFEILKETQIGKSVNALRKARKSASIRAFAKRLMEEWKNLVDEWVDAADEVAGAAGNSSEPAEPLNVDYQNGLPSPPLDEGAFITNHSTPEEIAKLFDDMDEDGNVTVSPNDQFSHIDGVNQQPGTRRKSPEQRLISRVDEEAAKVEKDKAKKLKVSSVMPIRDRERENTKGNRSHGVTGTGYLRNKDQYQNSQNRHGEVKRSIAPVQNKSGSGEDFKDIIEASKRKLQEGYRQAEDAKRKRTVQVMALEDIPKPTSRPNYGRPGFQHHRPWGNQHRR